MIRLSLRHEERLASRNKMLLHGPFAFGDEKDLGTMVAGIDVTAFDAAELELSRRSTIGPLAWAKLRLGRLRP